MSRVRVIPVLLLAREGLVKTQKFARPRYVGDPINAVRILNDKRSDELILLDIEAGSRGRLDLDRIEEIVSEAFMPVAYGGGVTSVEQCAALFRRGVEKVVINSAAHRRPELIAAAARRFGSQSVVVSIDVRRHAWRQPRVYVDGGRRRTSFTPVALARACEALGAGEIMLTSIDREGTYEGYDIELLRSVASVVQVPVIGHGGAGTLSHFEDAVRAGEVSAVAAGSMFVFAARGEGVLITYPSEAELEQLSSRVTADVAVLSH